jgi:hypothetical protein
MSKIFFKFPENIHKEVFNEILELSNKYNYKEFYIIEECYFYEFFKNLSMINICHRLNICFDKTIDVKTHFTLHCYDATTFRNEKQLSNKEIYTVVPYDCYRIINCFEIKKYLKDVLHTYPVANIISDDNLKFRLEVTEIIVSKIPTEFFIKIQNYIDNQYIKKTKSANEKSEIKKNRKFKGLKQRIINLCTSSKFADFSTDEEFNKFFLEISNEVFLKSKMFE